MTDAVLTPLEQITEETAASQRERSRIAFPYNDLDDVAQLAGVVHAKGDRCTQDQLAPALGYSNVQNGAFLMKLSAARHFGVASVAKQWVVLTPLGQRLADPNQEATARTEAFLSVPLYKALYDKYRGYALPSTNIGLEAVLVELGVTEKQKDKARQVLQRSAKQAGFFNQGQDRLVMPTLVAPFSHEHALNGERASDPGRRGSDSRDDGGGKLPTLIQGLIEKLPEEGSVWSQSEREQWLGAAKVIFGLVYKAETLALPAPLNGLQESTGPDLAG